MRCACTRQRFRSPRMTIIIRLFNIVAGVVTLVGVFVESRRVVSSPVECWCEGCKCEGCHANQLLRLENQRVQDDQFSALGSDRMESRRLDVDVQSGGGDG